MEQAAYPPPSSYDNHVAHLLGSTFLNDYGAAFPTARRVTKQDGELSTPEMLPVGLLDSPCPSPFPEEHLPPPQHHLYGLGSPHNRMMVDAAGDNNSPTAATPTMMNARAMPFIPQHAMAAMPPVRKAIEDIRGNVVRLSRDQEGSRLVQRILDYGVTEPDVDALLFEMTPCAVDLITDVFGNYVIQRMLDIIVPRHRKILLEAMRGHVADLALQTYGCRVLQKALEIADEEDRDMLATELEGHVARCVQDQNGNHVIQKCIECMPGKVDFIARAFRSRVPELATHAYGCRVLQRLLEHCVGSNEEEPILEEILANIETLVVDQYGNYVVQYLILNASRTYQQRLIACLIPRMLTLSRHKYASNVAEKMIERSDDLTPIVQHVVTYLPAPDGCSVLVAMMRDQYANYVVQKLLDVTTPDQRKILVDHIRPHVQSLRRYTYGKHIIARLEKMGTVTRGQGGSPNSQHREGQGGRSPGYGSRRQGYHHNGADL